MGYLLAGLAVLVVALVVFWIMLPRGGKHHRFVGTEFEPYVGVLFTAAAALSMTMILSGVLSIVGNP
jgi:hypothetical protein